MDNLRKQKMIDEAAKRMKLLGLDDFIIKDFVNDGNLHCSDINGISDVPEEILLQIEEWQNQFHNLVYHVIHGNFLCETYECLSVSPYEEDWEYETSIMDGNWVMSHSINVSIPSYTESGSIKVINHNGILKRIN